MLEHKLIYFIRSDIDPYELNRHLMDDSLRHSYLY